MITYFIIGALIGAGTGIPIGPVNVAVIDTAYRHTLRRAVAVGFGGALADGVYATAGILGMGPFLETYPAIPPILYAVSGLVLLVYGILTARSKPIPAAVEPSKASPPDLLSQSWRDLWAGFLLGVSLILLNPAAIVTWVLIVGSAFKGVTTSQGLAATIGVSVGSFGWFSLVAYLANHGKKVLGGKAVWITRTVGWLLVAYALYSFGKAIHIWFF